MSLRLTDLSYFDQIFLEFSPSIISEISFAFLHLWRRSSNAYFATGGVHARAHHGHVAPASAASSTQFKLRENEIEPFRRKSEKALAMIPRRCHGAT